LFVNVQFFKKVDFKAALGLRANPRPESGAR
jgi:hypothetical protein